jgi:hypothetical protein
MPIVGEMVQVSKTVGEFSTRFECSFTSSPLVSSVVFTSSPLVSSVVSGKFKVPDSYTREPGRKKVHKV